MKELSLEQMETTQGGKFIGIDESCTPCILGHMVCTKQLYVFWIPINDHWVSFDGPC
ncbi:MAG: hypothetical protein PHD06_09920 [Bacteroidales bacterium]|jgi:hypothetical protein|nr:hypothetical protein [Bacteroidales bacterium]MDD4385477.1 hypothetical protein [Bacteroidales bacterium]MDY0196416.1 hypothetical protein [Tenuifilaceae bacterium]